MIDLNKEAEEYATKHYFKVEAPDAVKDFIAGANSKYVEAKIIQAQIDILNSLFNLGLNNVHQTINTPVEIYNDVINPLRNKLQQKLKQIQNE